MLGPATTIPSSLVGSSESPEAADIDPSTATTSTTEYFLDRRNYRPGDCVTWDQRPGLGDRSTKVVACDTPHLLEFTALAEAPEQPVYPSELSWQAIIEARCGRLAEAHVGYPLDPSGRFGSAALQPTLSTWSRGDRKLACGISARSTASPGDGSFTPFTGAVKGQDQTMVAPEA